MASGAELRTHTRGEKMYFSCPFLWIIIIGFAQVIDGAESALVTSW